MYIHRAVIRGRPYEIENFTVIELSPRGEEAFSECGVPDLFKINSRTVIPDLDHHVVALLPREVEKRVQKLTASNESLTNLPEAPIGAPDDFGELLARSLGERWTSDPAALAKLIAEGIAVVFVPGSTAGITTIEFESGAINDLKKAIERIAPQGIPKG